MVPKKKHPIIYSWSLFGEFGQWSFQAPKTLDKLHITTQCFYDHPQTQKKVPCFPNWRFASISQESVPSTMWLDSCRVPWRKVFDEKVSKVQLSQMLDSKRCDICSSQRSNWTCAYFFSKRVAKNTNYVGQYWDIWYTHYYINLKWFVWQLSEASTALTLFDYNHKCWMYYSTSSEWKKSST